MISTQYTTEDLKRLPLRAIVAFAAGAEGRVHRPVPRGPPATRGPSRGHRRRHPARRGHLEGLGLRLIEPVVQALEATRALERRGRVRVRRGSGSGSRPYGGDRLARAQPQGESDRDADRWTKDAGGPQLSPHLANVTADIVALDAFTAAVEAANAAAFDDTFMRGAIRDYERLLGLNPGAYPRPDGLSTPRPMARSGRSERGRDGAEVNLSALPFSLRARSTPCQPRTKPMRGSRKCL